MFKVNEDKSIYVTRGDYCEIPVAAVINGEVSKFKSGDVLRFKATKKKDCNTVVIQRDYLVETETDEITFHLTSDDTRIGAVISKPTDYWYEVELNPDTDPQTIIGYDEDGAKVLKLFPEGADVNAEDIEVVGKQTLQDLVNTALANAKASGAFYGEDGKDGLPGQDGSDGITPHIGDNGNWFIGNTDTGKPSRGIQGEPGKAGQDGKSGADGKDGQPGKDGTSPVISVSDITGGHRITITDATGTKTVDVMDGKDGESGSGGGVTSWNDLTDKPFGSEVKECTVLAETSPFFDEEAGQFLLTDPVTVITGKQYTVNWNGTEYACTCTCVEFDDGVVNMQALGNLGAMGLGDETGEPFLIVVANAEEAAEFGVGLMIAPLDGSTELTISITGSVETVHKIPSKFYDTGTFFVDVYKYEYEDAPGNYYGTTSVTYGQVKMALEKGQQIVARLFGTDGMVKFDSNPNIGVFINGLWNPAVVTFSERNLTLTVPDLANPTDDMVYEVDV